MGIEALIGRPGSGKSYEATRRVLFAANRDRLVFTNYAVSHPNVYMFEPSQLMDLPPALVVIDEAHLWFPSRMSLKLPMSWLAGMSQTRKKGWDLLLVAQHESRLDRAVRDVCSWMHLCSAWGGHKGHPILFTSRTYEPEFFRRPDRLMGRSMHLFSSRVASAYDTFETLTQADHTRQKDDPYKKQDAESRGTRGGSVLDGLV